MTGRRNSREEAERCHERCAVGRENKLISFASLKGGGQSQQRHLWRRERERESRGAASQTSAFQPLNESNSDDVSSLCLLILSQSGTWACFDAHKAEILGGLSGETQFAFL